jgi:hypothetical protein
LGERSVKYTVDTLDASTRQRLSSDRAIHPKRGIETIDHRRAEFSHKHFAQAWLQMTVDDRPGTAYGRHRPIGLVGRKPPIEQLAQIGSTSNLWPDVRMRNEISKLPLGLSSGSSYRATDLVSSAGGRVGSGVDAYLPRVAASLSDRTLHAHPLSSATSA